jgi:hypothetical protein
MFSRTRRIRLFLLAWLVATAPYSVAAQRLSQQEIKAAYLINFAKFTEWPAASFPRAETPIVIGVAGDETLRHAIDRLAKGKLFGGRALRTRSVDHPADASQTHLVFFADSTESQTANILRLVSGLPVLTVGDAEGFSGAGGMIGVFLEDDRLRFDIRVDIAERAGLKVSSRVLMLARTVHGRK